MTRDYVDHYGTVSQILTLFLHIGSDKPGGAYDRTGMSHLIGYITGLLGYKIPTGFINYALGKQIALTGGYPEANEVVPSLICAAGYGIVMLLHIILFFVNFRRGHYFYLSLAWALVCCCRVLGFALRAAWSQKIYALNTALALEFFLIFATIVTVSFNLMLAQRLFTWRHPVGGSRRLFWVIMLGLYAAVLVIAGCTIFTHFIPYFYFLSKHTFNQYWAFVQTTSIVVPLYILCAMILIILSVWTPTSNDENLYTYQPWWIESFSPTYFVRKGAAQDAEQTFMKRNRQARHAIRVIAATHHYYNSVEGLTNQRGTLKHNWSFIIIVVSTLLNLVGALGRCVLVMENKDVAHSNGAVKSLFIYLTWGFLEWAVQVMYLVGRVDLRFYRPDRLPQIVRDIISGNTLVFGSRRTSVDVSQDVSETGSFEDDVANPNRGNFYLSDDESHHDYTDDESYLDHPHNYHDEKKMPLDDHHYDSYPDDLSDNYLVYSRDKKDDVGYFEREKSRTTYEGSSLSRHRPSNDFHRHLLPRGRHFDDEMVSVDVRLDNDSEFNF